VLAGHCRPLLSRGVAHDVAGLETGLIFGAVNKEEEAIAGTPEPDLADVRQLP
jgi:hypothetical protein